MKIRTYNEMNLTPIGKVRFRWSRNFRRDTEIQNVYIGDVEILNETDRNIDKDTYKALMKEMKEKNTDLLTDGTNFFTTRGEKITQIKHGGFESILNMHKD